MRRWIFGFAVACMCTIALSCRIDAAGAGVPSSEVISVNRMETAVRWAIAIAKNPRCGYSQGKENASRRYPYTGSREGPDYDCASFIYYALENAGFPVIGAWQANPASWERYRGRQLTGDTDTIWTDLQAVGGFTRYAWEDVSDSLERGDILCDPRTHAAIYIGGGKTVEAYGVENPIGGRWRTGDQGGEISFYEADDRVWVEVYRYTDTYDNGLEPGHYR